MSINTQRKLLFIPIINIISMFQWIKLCSIKSIRPLDFIKELLKMFLLFIVITVVRIIFSFAFDNELFNKIVTYISIYFYCFIMSWTSIRAQEKIYLNEHQNETKNRP